MSQFTSALPLLLSIVFVLTTTIASSDSVENVSSPISNSVQATPPVDNRTCFIFKIQTRVSIFSTKFWGSKPETGSSPPISNLIFTNCSSETPSLGVPGGVLPLNPIYRNGSHFVDFYIRINAQRKNLPKQILYLKVQFDGQKNQYSLSGGSVHVVGFVHVVKPVQNLSTIWVDIGHSSNCSEYLLRSEPLEKPSLQVKLTSLKLELLEKKISDFHLNYTVKDIEFSNKSVSICTRTFLPPSISNTSVPIVPIPQTCYVIKFAAKSKAILATSNSTINLVSASRSYRFTNCSQVPSFTQGSFGNSATLFTLPIIFNFNSSQSLPAPTVKIEIVFNQTRNYSIRKIGGYDFLPNRTFTLIPLNPGSNETSISLNQSGICDTYQLQSKLEGKSPHQLKVTFEKLKFQIFHTNVNAFQTLGSFSKNNVTVCGKSNANASSGMASYIVVIIGTFLFTFTSKLRF